MKLNFKHFMSVPVFGNVLVKTRFMFKIHALSVFFKVSKDYLTTFNVKIWLKQLKIVLATLRTYNHVISTQSEMVFINSKNFSHQFHGTFKRLQERFYVRTNICISKLLLGKSNCFKLSLVIGLVWFSVSFVASFEGLILKVFDSILTGNSLKREKGQKGFIWRPWKGTDSKKWYQF